jgi:carbonic anhydrase
LAAVLFSVAFRMLSPGAFLRLWRHSRGDALVYGVTFAVIVFVDLLEGIQWGIVAALVIAAVQLGRPRLVVEGARIGDSYVFALEGGALTFVSSLDLDEIRDELSRMEPSRTVVFDLRGVPTMDASGAELLGDLVKDARSRGLDPVVVGLKPGIREQFAAALEHGAPGEARQLSGLLVDGERELAGRLGAAGGGADARLRTGIERYRSTLRPRYASLFEKLASGQDPHTLFIACSDSRLDPNLITASDPGELFVVRDVGNLVPPASSEQASAVGGAIDFAVGVLGVSKIVVCGHSGCGAIKALLAEGRIPPALVNLEAWLEATHVRPLLRSLPSSLDVDEVAKLNVLSQLDHLRTYPVVADKLAAGEMSLAAWFFDVGRGEVEQWTEALKRFVRIGESAEALEPIPRPAPGRA